VAEDHEDPREVPWHPRLADRVLGHDGARALFDAALASGKPHHAWLISGPRGIGKATLAYKLASALLAQTTPAQTAQWISARAHPDLFVLERSLNDSKPRRLRGEIAVEDSRRLGEFFARTSGSGGWRVAIIDAVDDLSSESGNALLKLVEEPPPKSIIFLVCHLPGRSLRTLRSRCLKLPLQPLSDTDTESVLRALHLDPAPDEAELERAVRQSAGSPGRAIDLMSSTGAKAFDLFLRRPNGSEAERLAIANHFSARQQSQGDFLVFTDLLLGWLARAALAQPESAAGNRLSRLHQELSERRRIVEGYNLDRRMAVIEALGQVQDALKAA